MERRRREDGGAEWVGRGEGCPPFHWVRGTLGEAVPLPGILSLNVVSFGALWVVLFTVSILVSHAKRYNLMPSP